MAKAGNPTGLLLAKPNALILYATLAAGPKLPPEYQIRADDVMNEVVGLLLGCLIGAACRWLDIPVPAPPRIAGALLVVFMTLGFMAADMLIGA